MSTTSAVAEGKRAVVHTGAGRPASSELALLSAAAAPVAGDGVRDLAARPFSSWDDALEELARAARDEPLLLVLDELPELLDAAPELPGVLRAVWDRVRSRSRLRIIVSGSALRTMRRLAAASELGPDVVAVGRYWTATQPPVEIDGVVLAGRSRAAVAVAEAKWARRVDGAAVARGLLRKADVLPRVSDPLRLFVAAREEVRGGDVTPITAADVFAA